MNEHVFGQGAERVVFYATEVSEGLEPNPIEALAIGNRLVAKETIYDEELLNYTFHLKFCQVQQRESLCGACRERGMVVVLRELTNPAHV
jgi:hypothetical protein